MPSSYQDPTPPNPLDPGAGAAAAAPAPDDDETGVTFPMPDGFEAPKGNKPGKEFEALATLKVDDDGDLCLLKLDGTNVSPEDNHQAGEGAPGEDDTGGEPEGGNQGQSAVDSMKQNLPSIGLPSGART